MPQWMKTPNLASANHCMRAAVSAACASAPRVAGAGGAANAGAARQASTHSNAGSRNLFMAYSHCQLLRNLRDRCAQALQRRLDRHLDRTAFDEWNRSEEHTSDSSHMSISYAVFCLK